MRLVDVRLPVDINATTVAYSLSVQFFMRSPQHVQGYGQLAARLRGWSVGRNI